jgi:hypothetical protein
VRNRNADERLKWEQDTKRRIAAEIAKEKLKAKLH